MTPNEIKAALVLKGISLTDIAERAGSSVSEVSRCISGDGIYLKIRKVIARQLKRSLADVFAEHHPEPKKRYSWCKAA